jgi:nicotinate-nucleotide adenylyltransferase
VIWVPFGEPPHRALESDPGAEARFQMCEYATAADERFGVSRCEIDRPGPSYTVETLRELHARGRGDEYWLILGADQAAALPSWREPEEVLELATVAVAEREGHGRESVLEALSPLPGARERVVFFEMPRIEVSSTLVRTLAAGGRPIRYLVPDKVANFIGAQSLYGAAVGAER